MNKILNTITGLFFTLLIITVKGQNNESIAPLVYKGNVQYPYTKNIRLVYKCFYENALLYGVNHSDEENLVLEGDFKYAYNIGNDEKKNGTIDFRYRFQFRASDMEYTFDRFVHRDDQSPFKEIGHFSKSYSDTLENVISKEDYELILKDLDKNISKWLNSLDKDLVYCCQ